MHTGRERITAAADRFGANSVRTLRYTLEEVMLMFRKTILLAAALLFAVCAHLRPCYDCNLDGVPLASGYSPRVLAAAEHATRDTAEEILRESAALPTFRRRLRFTFRRPSRDTGALTDALLRSIDGVVLRDEVRVDGERLGWVSDGGALREALGGYIANTLPTWASGGVLSRSLEIRRLYTRDGYLTSQRDMVLLVTGAAPVFYYDGAGRFARA